MVARLCGRAGDRVRLAAIVLCRRRRRAPAHRRVVPSLGARAHGRAARLPVAPAIPLRDREPDHLPAAARGRRGVLLVHGFFCNRGLWNPWLRRLRAAATFPASPSTSSRSSARSTTIGRRSPTRWRRLEQATGLAPVIVAHSMGGLAVRAWLAAQPEARCHRLVTIASPHAGTRLGAHGRSANIAQMRLGSDWLAQLARGRARRRERASPASGAIATTSSFRPATRPLPGADNRHLAGDAARADGRAPGGVRGSASNRRDDG